MPGQAAGAAEGVDLLRGRLGRRVGYRKDHRSGGGRLGSQMKNGIADDSHGEQADNDRDVRHTAQFAVEIVQAGR